MHKTVGQHKKENGELQKQVEELRQLVGERDAEVRDLAYKDPPDQIFRSQHTEQRTRQLLGSEPLQAILGVICQKNNYNNKGSILTTYRRLTARILLQHYNNLKQQNKKERRRQRKTLQERLYYRRKQER